MQLQRLAELRAGWDQQAKTAHIIGDTVGVTIGRHAMLEEVQQPVRARFGRPAKPDA